MFNFIKTVNLSYKKSKLILTNNYDSKLAFYLFLTLIGGILEMFSIGMLLPILFILLDFNDNFFLSQIFNNFFSYLNLFSKKEQLLASVFFLSLGYLIKNLLLSYVYWFQGNITTAILIYLQNSFFSNYLNKSVLYHSKKNSSELIRNTMSETTQFTKGFIFYFLNLILDSTIIFCLLVVIFITDFKASMTITIFFVLIILIFSGKFRKYLKNMGIQRMEYEKFRLKYFQESIGSIREIKILGKVNYLVKQFSKYNILTNKIIRNSGLITILPRLTIETLFVFLISLIMIYFLFLDYNFQKITLILGMLGASAFRIMSIITRLINSINLIQYSKPSLDTLYEYFKDFSHDIETEDSGMADNNFQFNKNIILDNVHFYYSDKDIFKFLNLNLVIKKGEKVGIIGKSGSGKSTLIDLILGLIEPKSGNIKIDNFDLKANKRLWNKMIGYVPQEIFLADGTVLQNIGLGFENKDLDINKILELIKICNLEKTIAGFSNGINTIVGERGSRISGGQKQRIGLARSLYRNPSFLILDEATSAIDKDNEFEILSKIFEDKNKTILMITHRKDALKFCNKIIKIENGKILQINQQI
jgi:ABC-type bacteriocin/lantibiotic exporter with double-glycine peptidase domain